MNIELSNGAQYTWLDFASVLLLCGGIGALYILPAVLQLILRRYRFKKELDQLTKKRYI